MIIYAFEVSPQLLAAIPLEERTLFVGVGHISNELNALRKMILMSERTPAASQAEKNARSFQSLLLIKTFAAKACAGYEFLNTIRYLPFFQKFLDEPEGNATEPLQQLLGYFSNGKHNLLKLVRDKFAAHYDFDRIKAAAAKIPSKASHLYISKQQGNSLYFASEEVFFSALVDSNPKALGSAATLSQLIDDVDSVASWLTDIAQGVMIVITKLYADEVWKENPARPEGVSAIPYTETALPFFVEFSVPAES